MKNILVMRVNFILSFSLILAVFLTSGASMISTINNFSIAPASVIMSVENNKAPINSIYFADFSQASKFDLLLSGTDSNGNTWAVFDFKGSAKFGDITVTSDSLTKVFIAKLDKSGTWSLVKQISDSKISNLNFDYSGNVLFSQSTNLTKLNSTGDIVWSKKILEPNTKDGGSSIGKLVVAKDNSVYVSGYFYKTIDAGAIKKTSTTGNYDIFVMKFDPEANPIWISTAGGKDEENIGDIVVATDGSVYITGTFGLSMIGLSDPESYPVGVSASFGDIVLTSQTEKYSDLFVAKLDKDGNWLWAKQEDRPKAGAVTVKETNAKGQTITNVDDNSKACGDIFGKSLYFEDNNTLVVGIFARGGSHTFGSSNLGVWGCRSYVQPEFNFVAKLDLVSKNWISAKEGNIVSRVNDINGNNYVLDINAKTKQMTLSKMLPNGVSAWSKITNAPWLSMYKNQIILTGVSTGCIPTFRYICSNTNASSYDKVTRKYSTSVLYRTCTPMKTDNCNNEPLISGEVPQTLVTNNTNKVVASSTFLSGVSNQLNMTKNNDPKGIASSTNPTEFATKKGIFVYKIQ